MSVPLEGLENCDQSLSTVAVKAKPAEFRVFRPQRDDCDHIGTHSNVGKLWANLAATEIWNLSGNSDVSPLVLSRC